MKCPICNKEFTERPALSRKDNKTEICPECGMREAIAAMQKSEKEEKEKNTMQIEKLVKRYSIEIAPNGMLKMYKPDKNEEIEFIKTKKQKFIEYIKAENLKQKEIKEKIENIEGLKELKKAIAEEHNYREDLNKSFESEDRIAGLTKVKKPETNIREIAKKYPRANAYLQAETYSFSHIPEKAIAGETARIKIINGEDWVKAIEEMKEKVKNYTEAHIWD